MKEEDQEEDERLNFIQVRKREKCVCLENLWNDEEVMVGVCVIYKEREGEGERDGTSE